MAANIGGPLAVAQSIEKFLSKPEFGGPNGLFPPGNPSIRWGPSPPTSIDGFPGGKKPLGLPESAFEKNFSMGLGSCQGPSYVCRHPDVAGGGHKQTRTRIQPEPKHTEKGAHLGPKRIRDPSTGGYKCPPV